MNTPILEEYKDKKILFVTLLMCNLASGTTTVFGAIQIFPKIFVGGVAGTFIQALLFLLTSGQVKDAPFIRLTSSLFLASLSVYTSFFSYYEQLTSSQQAELAGNLASSAHFNLVEEVFTPIENDIHRLNSEYLEKQKQLAIEIDRGLYTNESGYGPVARQIENESIAIKTQYEQLSSLVNQLKPKFEYELKDLTPEEILIKDKSALASVPSEFRPAHLINQESLSRSQYIDEDQDIPLLAPYHKIKKLEEPALISMGLAIGLDSMIISLGFALSGRRKEEKLGILKLIIRTIRGSKEFIAEVENEIVIPVDIHPIDIQREKLDEVIKTVHNSGISVSLFIGHLMHLFKEIEKGDYIIDSSVLIERMNESDARSRELVQFYKILFTTMQHTLGWLEYQGDEKWKLKNEHCCKCFINWIRQEVMKASSDEKSLRLQGRHSNTKFLN
ncbi:MAG: hypothetical protein AAF289_00045 [Cyanobacteria bacterium P01_A01_bin.135]